MSKNLDYEEILKARQVNVEMDLRVLENQQKRLDQEKAKLVLKLVATREALIAASEQDE